MVVDLDSGAGKSLSSEGAKRLSPYLTLDGERLSVVRRRDDTAKYELLLCFTTKFACRRLIVTTDSICFPTEISADKNTLCREPGPTLLRGRTISSCG
jgi:hypothetical protein